MDTKKILLQHSYVAGLQFTEYSLIAKDISAGDRLRLAREPANQRTREQVRLTGSCHLPSRFRPNRLRTQGTKRIHRPPARRGRSARDGRDAAHTSGDIPNAPPSSHLPRVALGASIMRRDPLYNYGKRCMYAVMYGARNRPWRSLAIFYLLLRRGYSWRAAWYSSRSLPNAK